MNEKFRKAAKLKVENLEIFYEVFIVAKNTITK